MQMEMVIVCRVQMAATQVPQDHRLALFVPMAATQVPQDHRLATMSQMVITAKSVVVTLPAAPRHQSLAQ